MLGVRGSISLARVGDWTNTDPPTINLQGAVTPKVWGWSSYPRFSPSAASHFPLKHTGSGCETSATWCSHSRMTVICLRGSESGVCCIYGPFAPALRPWWQEGTISPVNEFLTPEYSLLTSYNLPCPSATRAGDHWGEFRLAGMFPLGLSTRALLLKTPLFLGAWSQRAPVDSARAAGARGKILQPSLWGLVQGLCWGSKKPWKDNVHMVSYSIFTPEMLPGTKGWLTVMILYKRKVQ